MVTRLDFRQATEDLKHTGFSPNPDKVFFSLPNARELLMNGLHYFAGENATWLPEYSEIASWLEGNNGLGLLCYGNCGRGKSLICGKIIPILLHHYCRKIVSCYDSQTMNNNPDEVKNKHIIYIDDVGIENISVKYGEKRLVFPEIVDEAEKKGKLLILSTNLSKDEILQKYGERTMDRLNAITKRVRFVGKSLRV